MTTLPITVPEDLLATFCRQNQIRKLSLFGSVLTPRFGPESDLDVLVEFEPGTPVSYFDLAGMEIELSEVAGRKVDLRTAEELSKYFRDKVVALALPQYEGN